MPAPDNGTRRRIDVPGADWYWEQDDQLRLTYLSSRTSEKTALDLALDLTPYLGHKRCDQGALRAICEGEGWDCAELWKVEETGGALRLHQHWSTLDAQGAAAVVEAAGKSGIKRGEGMVGSVWQSGKPLWIRDYLQQAGAERIGDELFEKMGLRAALLVPLRAGPEIVGVLRFGSRAMRAPDERLSDRPD